MKRLFVEHLYYSLELVARGSLGGKGYGKPLATNFMNCTKGAAGANGGCQSRAGGGPGFSADCRLHTPLRPFGPLSPHLEMVNCPTRY